MQAKWQAKEKRRSEPQGHSQTLWVMTGHRESREGSWGLSPESAPSPHTRPSLALSDLLALYSSHMSSQGQPQEIQPALANLRNSLKKM